MCCMHLVGDDKLSPKSITKLYFVLLFIMFIQVSGCVATDPYERNCDVPETDVNATKDMSDISNKSPVPLDCVYGATYSEADDRKVVYATTGDIIAVKLRENPGTGHSWDITFSKGFELLDDTYKQDTVTENIVGAAGIRQWIFEVTEAGEHNISAVYLRPWEDSTGNESIFNLSVSVLE